MYRLLFCGWCSWFCWWFICELWLSFLSKTYENEGSNAGNRFKFVNSIRNILFAFASNQSQVKWVYSNAVRVSDVWVVWEMYE